MLKTAGLHIKAKMCILCLTGRISVSSNSVLNSFFNSLKRKNMKYQISFVFSVVGIPSFE